MGYFQWKNRPHKIQFNQTCTSIEMTSLMTPLFVLQALPSLGFPPDFWLHSLCNFVPVILRVFCNLRKRRCINGFIITVLLLRSL